MEKTVEEVNNINLRFDVKNVFNKKYFPALKK